MSIKVMDAGVNTQQFETICIECGKDKGNKILLGEYAGTNEYKVQKFICKECLNEH